MDQIPEFFRTETWHPLFVHLPVAVLLLSSVFIVFGVIVSNKFMTKMGSVLLIIGTIGAWLAVYTGNMADGIVSRQLCDPTVLKSHENAAYLLSWLFTGASLMVIVNHFWTLKSWIIKVTQLFTIVLLLAGSGFLVYTGHLGAKLVYQQAAGVYVPSEDCAEFE